MRVLMRVGRRLNHVPGVSVVDDIYYSANFYSDRAQGLIRARDKAKPFYLHLTYQSVRKSATRRFPSPLVFVAALLTFSAASSFCLLVTVASFYEFVGQRSLTSRLCVGQTRRGRSRRSRSRSLTARTGGITPGARC